MSFRRMPFQFTTTDPVERQRELERRFGLPASRNMFVDVPNPLFTGAVPRESGSGSPRLQHRVPIFVEGHDQPIHSSVNSTGSYPENKKPNVRVIPIEIEGAESRPARHRTLSGPVSRKDDSCERNLADGNKASPLKHSMTDLTRPSKIRNTAGSVVHNIPIQIEGSKDIIKNANLQNVRKSPKKDPKVNGCTVTKTLKSPGKENKANEVNKVKPEEQQNIGLENSLKKIENVLEELKTYEAEVQEFSGSNKDKKYRYLDEMLTRCMIKLDDVDTMGNENIRTTRKNAVKRVQAQIDLLERKVNVSETSSVNESHAATSEIKDVTVGEISSSESEVCESLKKDEASEDDQLTNDTESKEKPTELDIKSEVEQINEDIEMTESEAVTKSINENVEGLPVTTMSEEPESIKMIGTSDNKEESERPALPLIQSNAKLSDMHEVEMKEIGESSPTQDENLEHCKIEEEIAEKDSQINMDLSNEDHVESRNEQIIISKEVCQPVTTFKEQESELNVEMLGTCNNKNTSEQPAFLPLNQANTEQPGNMLEVEMAEICEPLLDQDASLKNFEIENVELAEKNINQINTNSLGENSIVSGNEQLINPEDVEMNDTQNMILHDTKQVLEEILIKKESSQYEEEKSNENLENNADNFVGTPCSSSNVVIQHKNCENNPSAGTGLLDSEI